MKTLKRSMDIIADANILRPKISSAREMRPASSCQRGIVYNKLNRIGQRMKFYVVSDLHGNLEGLDPSGVDAVLIAGDFSVMTGWGAAHMAYQLFWVQDVFCKWCVTYPKTMFFVVPGNHDLFAEREELRATIKWPSNVKMLVDEGCEFNGHGIYGAPWVPFINGSWAFEEVFPGHLKERFAAIPNDLDILITHSPPMIRHKKIDVSIDANSPHFGSADLTDAIMRFRPRFVFCGHIHTGDHNPITIDYADGRRTILRNVSRLDEEYKVRYEPYIFEL